MFIPQGGCFDKSSISQTTTLLNKAQTYIHGIQSMDAMEFTLNYSLEQYKRAKALENKNLYFALYFGESGDGSDGKFEWQGELTTWATGHGVNEVREMIISIAPSTEIEEKTVILHMNNKIKDENNHSKST